MFENALINRRRCLATQLFLSLQETKPDLFFLLPLPPGRKKQQRHVYVNAKSLESQYVVGCFRLLVNIYMFFSKFCSVSIFGLQLLEKTFGAEQQTSPNSWNFKCWRQMCSKSVDMGAIIF